LDCSDEVLDLAHDQEARDEVQCVMDCKSLPFCVARKCGRKSLACVADKTSTCHKALMCLSDKTQTCASDAKSCVLGRTESSVCRDMMSCATRVAGACRHHGKESGIRACAEQTCEESAVAV